MSILKIIDDEIFELNKKVNWAYYARTFVLEHLSTFDSLPDATLAVDKKIDFDNLSHEQVMEVIKAFPGRWKKEPNQGRVHYSIVLRNASKTSELYEIVIRCYNGEPPPNCQIVYEDVHVPAQIVKRAKMVCRDAPHLNGNHASEALENVEEAQLCE